MKNGYWSIVKRVMAGLMAAAILLAAGSVHTAGRAHAADSAQAEVQVCDEDVSNRTLRC